MANLDETYRLAREIMEENGYTAIRVLPDGSIAAVCELLFTRSIILGVNRTGYENRFCFEDKDRAIKEFWELKSEDDVPEGFIAKRVRDK